MPKPRSQIGDVFCATLDTCKRYLQHVANDRTQLDSAVIRVFKTNYALDGSPDLDEIVTDEVDFYAHVFLTFARKLKTWDKVGNAPVIGKIDVLFRDSSDYGNPSTRVSHNWWIWRINENQKQVGELKGANRSAEIGIVISPVHIIHRMRTGQYDFVYPLYD